MSEEADTVKSAEQALGRIPGFTTATIEARLSNGPTNASFRVARGDARYVLRLDKPGAASLGLSRVNEFEVYRTVVAAGLAPEPVYVDPATGVFLRPWLEGRSWMPADLESPDQLERLAALLRRLHALPGAGTPFDPLAAARRYATHVDSTEAADLLRQAEDLARRISKNSTARALCHNDPVCHNVLDGEELALIDWEYAGAGDPFFDLAVVVQHHDLDRGLTRSFLRAYLGESASADDRKHLELQCEFYARLLQLWNLRIAAI